MATEFTIEGMDRLKAALAEAGTIATKTLAETMYTEMETIMERARGLVPVETGALRDSGKVSPPEIMGEKVTVEGGFGTKYAIVVHEKMGVHHPKGQAKFLEQPMLERTQRIPMVMADKLRAAWARLAR